LVLCISRGLVATAIFLFFSYRAPRFVDSLEKNAVETSR
jgi:hypothetical protein